MFSKADLIDKLRKRIGDTDTLEPNMTDAELLEILEDSAREYSRIKSIKKFHEIEYNREENVYPIPDDSIRVEKVEMVVGSSKVKIDFIDNLYEIILEREYDVQHGTLKITYNKFFTPCEIDKRELDLYLHYCEALCYKLMASKTADLVKFSTGEKSVDESLISEKYLKLYERTVKAFRKKAIRSYGKRADNIKESLDYPLPYPTMGETP